MSWKEGLQMALTGFAMTLGVGAGLALTFWLMELLVGLN